jgi:hypothetical protein
VIIWVASQQAAAEISIAPWYRPASARGHGRPETPANQFARRLSIRFADVKGPGVRLDCIATHCEESPSRHEGLAQAWLGGRGWPAVLLHDVTTHTARVHVALTGPFMWTRHPPTRWCYRFC